MITEKWPLNVNEMICLFSHETMFVASVSRRYVSYLTTKWSLVTQSFIVATCSPWLDRCPSLAKYFTAKSTMFFTSTFQPQFLLSPKQVCLSLPRCSKPTENFVATTTKDFPGENYTIGCEIIRFHNRDLLTRIFGHETVSSQEAPATKSRLGQMLDLLAVGMHRTCFLSGLLDHVKCSVLS